MTLVGDLILNSTTIRERLHRRSLSTHDEEHPWRSNLPKDHDKPLFRLWDVYSGSRLFDGDRMLSRTAVNTPRQPRDLSTYSCSAPRSQNTDRHPVYIIHKLSDDDQDPEVRRMKGPPVLDIEAEMQYYNIPDPYIKSARYYKNHYVCLWEVTPVEIIDWYDWNSLKDIDNWYG
ncbi:hypothetical protein CC79DRAFT_1372423 [Sarocladium strictum]